MDLREQLLPNEKLLSEYNNLLVENKRGNVYLTNLRLFLSTKKNIWNFNTNDIKYMGRMNNPRFSWMWQILISLTLLYSILSGKTLLFLVCIILSAARQYLKIDCLEIGLENKKWIVSDDNEQLDELMLQIQTNQVTGLEKSEGKPIVDAEEELNTRIEINIVGENESGPLRSAWISLSFAFIFYYLNSFSDSGNIWLFVLLISALCSYIIYKDRRNTNILRDVEPENGLIRKGWYFLLNKLKVKIIKANYSLKVYNKKIEVRNLGYILSSVILLLTFTITHINSNLIPMLFGISLAISVYMTGRCLAGIPRPRNRMVARSFVCTLVAICVILPCLNAAPLFMPANALLSSNFLDVESGNGWKKSYSQVDEYGLGLASTSIYLYADDAKDSEGNDDGYPAILFVIVLKVPFEIDEAVPLDILNDQFQKMAIEQDIELDAKLESGSRKTSQGYDTEYVIYNGTTKTEKIGTDEINYKVTKGSESKYIGEVWKAPEYNLLVVSMGIGIISSETINEDTGFEPIDDLVDDLIPNPTDTTDEKNWNEMLNLIPEIYCYQEDWKD
ncbi:MAG: hypothetical protein BEU03_00370 [Marine Group III euryarchaeote CG-Epi6]|uniref:Uncharacterized protein n=1 Tax=Marine Group III euryarchaeote CG-Epi6 TaxID=1889000 RepID=A0A1J5SVY7_9ARCH|nr:MAG: hypothetical protein BEU03_00370 [Marine Group III euryarchaeote CG-Epi6]